MTFRLCVARARGQWLATFLRLGRLPETRPVLRLTEDDRDTARALTRTAAAPLVALAPHSGRYTLPLLGAAWQRARTRFGERVPAVWRFWSLISGGKALGTNRSPPFAAAEWSGLDGAHSLTAPGGVHER